MKDKKLIIVSGLSGAGKSQVLNILEDNEYFCVDNLPVQLLDKFISLVKHTKRSKFAIGIDIRSAENVDELVKVFEKFFLKKDFGFDVIKIFLEANMEVLIERFSETRRKHPLGGQLILAIKKEQQILQKIKKISDYVIDTSHLNISELRNKILSILENKSYGKLNINIISFGYKFGLPLNADVVFDARFLPNPNYVDSLKNFTGKDKKVQEYVLKSKITQKFLNYIKKFINFILPQVFNEGKNYFTIAFGCTGGQHRSVTLAEVIYKYLLELKKIKNYNYSIFITHRDI
ncbi:MAG: RNase adapter RapZ [Endomicrobia bacterium]|nr:RNase adapter RapZ [Endomicrobiia bacterium]